jgi:hypothetical protein
VNTGTGSYWDKLVHGGGLEGATMQTSGSSMGQAAGRPQPQTTLERAGGPFIRYAQPGRRSQYLSSANAMGGVITQPLVAVPGYIRGYRVNINAGSGVNGNTTIVAAADAPFSVISLVQLKDAFGTPLIVAPGFEGLYLVPLFSGGFGLDVSTDVTLLPSFSGVSTGSTGTGNFNFPTYLPLEFNKGYGVISGANASLLPTLQWNLAASSSVYTTAPGTVPTVNLGVDADFYWLPEGVAVEPPGLGSTRQWVLQQANPTVTSAATSRNQLPRLGGYLDTLVFISRNTSAARYDVLPGFATNAISVGNTSRFQFYVDGVPLLDTTTLELLDDMQINFGWLPTSTTGGTANITGGNSRPAGVFAITRKLAINQKSMGLFDTGETFLSTNPGTLMELAGAPWGTFATGPATMNCLVGQVVPTGALIQGLPEI